VPVFLRRTAVESPTQSDRIGVQDRRGPALESAHDHKENFNPNSDFRNLPFGPKPMLQKLLEHLFGVQPRHLAKNKFVLRQMETRPRSTRQIPKLANPTVESRSGAVDLG